MKLIDDWKTLHKKWSVQAAAAAASLQGTWLIVPDWAKAALPSSVGTAIAYVVTVLIFAVPILRSIDQTPKADNDAQ